jgi:hypothetical protein
MMPKWRQGNVRDDASAAMMATPRWRQWQLCQVDVRKDTSTATATMPKQRQGNVHDDASAVRTPATRRQQWQRC